MASICHSIKPTVPGHGRAANVYANDVIKMPDVPRYTAEYRKHLSEIFA
ncbi:oxidoreductase [Salmonella enterica subsp. enterica]|uniref:Oxidoreductase n=1 Tax=Salmonella enterica I TaxID=59201 RepID=A0A379WLX0_SALET|nr:oxidoreductase [Salmonella enterica subsp. enterica]